ncbi:MAG TPA: N-methyl-L-tryptophan oxidase [Chthoniobacterales bacterium]|jgi:sarcosine oxidase|nr:N-methyl-L-tryptophan oxidase [Chthoniobacterales bacterium]
MRYDVAVVGLGGMGSAILANCAGRGASAIGLEQFERGHELGSSSGKSRMIRKAYFEDPAYVPLVLRAYDLWRELERTTGQELLRITGLLMVGDEAAEVITGAKRAAREHQLPLETLTASEIRARYPMLRVQDNEVGIFENDGGVLDPEKSVQAQLQTASAAGAEARFGVAMKSWEPADDGFVVSLADGTTVESRALVFSVGSWFQAILQKLGVAIQVQRNVQTWFTPASDAYAAARFPPFLLDRAGLPAPLYGFPDFGDGVKAAFHSHGDFSAADQVVREVDEKRDIAPIVRAMEAWMPGATATFRAAKPCPYSLTPDGHFVVDRHPDHPRLVLCGGFSGHGFKFAPVIGEISADLALENESRHDIEFLSLRRFASA